MHYIPRFFYSFFAFLPAGLEKSDPLTTILNEFIDTFKKLFEINYDELTTNDTDTKKIPLTVMNILSNLIHHIPVESSTLSVKVINWMKDVALNNAFSTNKQVAPVFIDLLFDVNIKFKLSMTLFEHVSIKLGDTVGFLTENEENAEDYKCINLSTVNYVMASLTGGIKTVLDDVDSAIARLKSEAVIMALPNEASDKKKELLRNHERSVCCQLCCLATTLTNLCNCTVPSGNLSESILKNLSVFYASVLNLTKYLIWRSSEENPVFEACRFERLVKLCCKQLAPSFYQFVTYLEANQKVGKRKDSDSAKNKVLKGTKFLSKLIYEMEHFRKLIAQLAKKTKIDLSKYISHGTVRDFRVKELETAAESGVDSQESGTTMDLTRDESEDDNDDEDEENTPPPTKKSKR